MSKEFTPLHLLTELLHENGFRVDKKVNATLNTGEPFFALYVSKNTFKFIIEVEANCYYLLDGECQRLLKTRKYKKLKERINELARITN